MNKIKIYTIGFTKKGAGTFFGLLMSNPIKKVLDIRLNNVSQLAGFSKKDDLKYFLRELCNIDYVHLPELAPTKDILDEYKKNKGDWAVYETQFKQLMAERQIETEFSPDLFDHACLLCSEHEPALCHRRLVAEYLLKKWGNVEIIHL